MRALKAFCLAMVLGILCHVAPASAQEAAETPPAYQALLPNVEWQPNLAAAFNKSVKEQKPMLVLFIADWSKYSHQLCQELKDNRALEPYRDAVVFVVADPERDDASGNVKSKSEELKIELFPSLVLLRSTQTTLEEAARIAGYFPPADHEQELSQLLAGVQGAAAPAPASVEPSVLPGNTIEPASAATSLDGEWEVVSLIVGGKPTAVPENVAMIIRGGEMTLVVGENRQPMGALCRDASHGDRDVDLVSDRGTEKSLFSIDGDTLSLCVALPGRERPIDFATPGGGTILVLKRKAS